MKGALIELLRCPSSGQQLSLDVHVSSDGDVEAGCLTTVDGKTSYPIVNGIPRFVPPQNYASTFGLQWNRFRRTQLDSHSGAPISRDRFFAFSGWSAEELNGKLVLDVGCGAGRFAEVALDCGAHVVAVDYSSAVDACRANHRHHPRLDVIQADIYQLPLPTETFDFVYCFGVLQHTPNPRAAFLRLPPMLRPGGKLAIDVYPWSVRNAAWSKYWVRPFTRRMDPQRLFAVVEACVPTLLPVSRLLGRVPRIGRRLHYVLPVANYKGVLPLNDEQLLEWSILDTFDMLSPTHDHPTEAHRDG